MMESATEQQVQELEQQLVGLLGRTRVLSDPKECAFYSTDVYSAGKAAALVIQPESREQVAEAAKLITDHGFAVIARGGGVSYTGGYTPQRESSVVVDLRGLNRIVEIAAQDMFITVEAGVTWQQIYKKLQPLGLRLPFFGTFSGSYATVGGGLSNGALFMATARYGGASDIVLGLEVVTATGRVIKTGQAGFRNGRPFYRNHGPDFTSAFVHDAGSLGIKTLATLKLIRTPSHAEYASFAFTQATAAVAALSEVARSDACEEAYIFDPVTTASNLEQHAGLKQDLKTLGAVLRGQSSLLKGIRESAKLVAAGRDFAAEGAWVLHTLCAGRSAAAVGEDLKLVRSISVDAGGTEIANSIPKAARAAPFGPLNGIIGQKGERWAALNAKVAHSDAAGLIKATDDLLAGYASQMEALKVRLSFLFIAISNHAFSYEPVLRWDDEWLPLHRHIPEPAYLEKLREPPANPQARQLVAEIRDRIVQLFADFGAASNQLGKTYPYLESLQPEGRRLLTSLKQELDPQGLMNPGALGDFVARSENGT